MVYSCIIIIIIIIIPPFYVAFIHNQFNTELAERDTINQPVIYCTLIGGCLK